MHRILLYALVIGLVYLSWSSRPGATHAALDAGSAAGAAADAQPGFAPEASADAGTLAQASSGPELLRRLEQRIQRQDSGWDGLTSVAAGEAVLERPEESFAEWLDRGRAQQASESAALLSGRHRPLSSESRGEPQAPSADEQAEPFYVVSLARVESLNSNLPPWSGLLDLALDPAAVSESLREAGAASRAALTESAWLSDEQGVLLARVSALDGLGMVLDPSWPWMPRARRLMLSPMGSMGLSARQYRIVLYGADPSRTWTGRLVLIAMPRAPGYGGR